MDESLIIQVESGYDDIVGQKIFEEIFNNEVYLSTAEMRQILGDIPLNSPDVLLWVREYLNDQYESF